MFPIRRLVDRKRTVALTSVAALTLVLMTVGGVKGLIPHASAATNDVAADRPVFCSQSPWDDYGHDAVNLLDSDDLTEVTFDGATRSWGEPHDWNELACTIDLGQNVAVSDAVVVFGDHVPKPVGFGFMDCSQDGINAWQLEVSTDLNTWTLVTPAIDSGHATVLTPVVDAAVNTTFRFARATFAACWGGNTKYNEGIYSLRLLSSEASLGSEPQLKAAHNPPLLVAPGETPELQYDTICRFNPADTVGCEPEGTVTLTATDGTSQTVPLQLGAADRKWRLYSAIPSRFLTAGSRFTYYANIRDGNTGAAVTIPAAGSTAPEIAYVSSPTYTIDLGTTTFPAPTAPAATVVSGGWGAGDAQFGFDGGSEQSQIGPSAFVVDSSGTVTLLDSVNNRLAAVTSAGVRTNVPLALGFSTEDADLAQTATGLLAIAEPAEEVTGGVRTALVNTNGQVLRTSQVVATQVDQLRDTPAGTFAHLYPADMWSGPLLGTGAGVDTPQPGMPLSATSQLISKVTPGEAQFAVVTNGAVTQEYRITSATAFGELQLAQMIGNDLVVVLRQWDDNNAQFRVLRLSGGTITKDITIDPAEYAETASISRFRIGSGGLYMARSDASGFSIARYDIGSIS